VNLIKRGVMVVMALRVSPQETISQLKTLFNYLEITYSSCFDGLLHKSDFEKVEADKREGIKFLFNEFGRHK
jgi:hypothetical protein